MAITLGLMALENRHLRPDRVLPNRRNDRWLFTLGLAQAGEFGFVLLSFTVASSVIPAADPDSLARRRAIDVVDAIAVHRVRQSDCATLAKVQTTEADEIDEKGTVIVPVTVASVASSTASSSRPDTRRSSWTDQ